MFSFLLKFHIFAGLTIKRKRKDEITKSVCYYDSSLHYPFI